MSLSEVTFIIRYIALWRNSEGETATTEMTAREFDTLAHKGGKEPPRDDLPPGDWKFAWATDAHKFGPDELDDVLPGQFYQAYGRVQGKDEDGREFYARESEVVIDRIGGLTITPHARDAETDEPVLIVAGEVVRE